MQCVTVFTCEKRAELLKKQMLFNLKCNILIKNLCFLMNFLAKKSECDIMH